MKASRLLLCSSSCSTSYVWKCSLGLCGVTVKVYVSSKRASARECSISKSKGCEKYRIEPFARSRGSPVEPGPVYRHMKTSFVISSICLADKTSNSFFFRPALLSLVQIVGQVELGKVARCSFFAPLTRVLSAYQKEGYVFFNLGRRG